MLVPMGHREDLLAGAVRCLQDKGYAHTTARDIVAASGTNLASIGYHYGSTKALLNAAVLQSMDDFGAQMALAIGTDAETAATTLERFERFWTRVIDSFRVNSQVWLATFDIFAVAQRDPEVRAAVADGLEDARTFWAQALYGVDPADTDPASTDPASTEQASTEQASTEQASTEQASTEQARAIGSLHQALISGVMVQWLIDPDRAPSPAALAQALAAIAAQVSTEPAGGR